MDATGALDARRLKVTLLNQDARFTQTDMNTRDGAFSFPALTVGTYRLTEGNVRGR